MNDQPNQPSEAGDEFRLDELLLAFEEGTLSEADRQALNERLRTDPAARTEFARLQMLSIALQEESGRSPGPSSSSAFPPQNDSSLDQSVGLNPSATEPFSRIWNDRSVLRWAFAAAAAVLVAVSVRWVQLETRVTQIATQSGAGVNLPADRVATEEPTSSGIAVVTQLVDANEAVLMPSHNGANAPRKSLAVNAALQPGSIALDSGWAQIEFLSGATVVLHGPAEMELVSSAEAIMHRGRIRAEVPPAARGFVVRTNDMKVVDLGTEFGLEVSDEGANVQVFDGEVELHTQSKQPQLVQAGNSLRKGKSVESGLQPSDMTPDRFVDAAKLQQLAETQQLARYRRWQQHSESLRSDPRLIAYFAMDTPLRGERFLKNDTVPRESDLDGAIVGATVTEGRWATKSALQFKRPGDRVRVNVPGEFGSLTMATWVRIDSLDRWYNSLFLTDSYQRGEPHWQILDTGQIHFSVRPSTDGADGEPSVGPPHYIALSPSFWNPSLSGQWLHLAVVYDVDAGTTTHYLNGDVLSVDHIPAHQLVRTTRIGMASIGNWSTPLEPDEHYAIRNLNGSMDELAIFAAALSPTEIKEMVEHGKP
ncbi:FecR domain-containing protein [Rhodopirellula sp. JC740]|uniref:FecR domain-containing protein n=1 Tax=Rhodopirellula halodulae TaxID=2894198 RepID=A0ABS8NMD8_9BACT|nr:FecR domain-containing protein [Rhodopirellula sp. JC740]